MVPDTERKWIQAELRSAPLASPRIFLIVVLVVLALFLLVVATC